MENQEHLDFNSFYFHNLTAFISENHLDCSLTRLESILQSRAILSRSKQKEFFANSIYATKLSQTFSKPRVGLNGEDYISICQYKSFNETSPYPSSAFEDFVRANSGIILVLSGDVKNLIEQSRRFGDGELQVKDMIPLNYISAILCGCKSIKEISEDIKLAKSFNLSDNEISKIIPEIITPEQEKILKSIIQLLKKHNVNIPIYSSRDGYPILSTNQIMNKIFPEVNEPQNQ